MLVYFWTMPDALIIFLCLGILYFAPALIAASKKKKNAGAIFALNFFLGWTFFGWVFALIWSLTQEPRPKIVLTYRRTVQD
ncbi:MAG TPA: superinfection immunity protein [Candidatus Acidoferrales bacterium]|nr:superinfection immunity protein [Candidatus Acidoferrales bacterium]